MTKEEKLSPFARFWDRFTSWNPWRRVFFVSLIVLLVACIPMLLVWIFPPPIIVTNFGAQTPNLELANNWPIGIPVAMVVLGVFSTNLVFRTAEDPRFYLRFTSLIVCAEIAILASTVAMAARMYWFWVFAPILYPSPNPLYPIVIPIEPFPGVWVLSGILSFIGAQGYFLPLLLLAGGTAMLIVFICESAI